MPLKVILLVDEAKGTRQLLSFLLDRRGFEVVEAGDGREAAQKVVEWDPDLILMEGLLPHKSGFELLGELKRDPRRRHIPVLLMTSVTRQFGQSDAYWRAKTGADEFLAKPFRVEDLLERVEKLLTVRT